jgi:SET domain-containing protein
MKRQCQVFWVADGKGWGIRAYEALPIGSCVFEVVGEILTNGEMEKRLLGYLSRCRNPNILNVALNADLGLEEHFTNNMPLYIDATFYGNVAHFLNHWCWNANLIDVHVLIESEALYYYHVLFENPFLCTSKFASSKV